MQRVSDHGTEGRTEYCCFIGAQSYACYRVWCCQCHVWVVLQDVHGTMVVAAQSHLAIQLGGKYHACCSWGCTEWCGFISGVSTAPTSSCCGSPSSETCRWAAASPLRQAYILCVLVCLQCIARLQTKWWVTCIALSWSCLSPFRNTSVSCCVWVYVTERSSDMDDCKLQCAQSEFSQWIIG